MFQTDLLKGRTIFLTGGGTGLGHSMVLRFAELGANLFLVGRRVEPLKETAEAIRAKGARAAYASAAASRPSSSAPSTARPAVKASTCAASNA